MIKIEQLIIPILEPYQETIVVSSRVLAEQLNIKHDAILQDLKKISREPKTTSLFIMNEYKDKNEKKKKEYFLTKDGFTLYMFNIPNHKELKIAYLKAFIQKEKVTRTKQHVSSVPDEITKLRQKANYVDKILQNKSLLYVTQIAKDYGMSGAAFNKLLHEHGIQYKLADQWLLYSNIASKGYVGSEIFNIEHSDGLEEIKMNTKWTQKGRLFLYEVLKSKGILPILEQNQSD